MSDRTVPPRAPARAPCFDPSDPRYWDPKDLEAELLRAYHICADCRMCVTFCGSFPILFEKVDRDVEAGRAHSVELVDPATIAKVTDHCWQCKLCYIRCPYTPDEGAYEALDFPRLLLREKAVRARRDGVKVVDRFLGEPQLIGALHAGPQARLVNFVASNRLVRKVGEVVAGISADFPLPPFAEQRFSRWFAAHEPHERAGEAGRVVLFATCYGEFNYPEVARATVEVLEHNGFEVVLVPEATCCGMPNLDGGDLDGARAKMRQNVSALAPLVAEGLTVVTPGPTCGYTMKREWPEFLGTEDARRVGAATRDLLEFLDALRREKRLEKRFERGYGKIGYHAACHLRAQKIGTPGQRLLRLLPDTEVSVVERCSAVDGTWGMKAEYHDEGARYGTRLTRALVAEQEEGVRLFVSDCNLAGLRVLQGAGRHVVHPIQVLAAAYGYAHELPLLEEERS